MITERVAENTDHRLSLISENHCFRDHQYNIVTDTSIANNENLVIIKSAECGISCATHLRTRMHIRQGPHTALTFLLFLDTPSLIQLIYTR